MMHGAKRGRPWTDAERAECRRLRQVERLTMAAIGARLGRSPMAVGTMLNRENEHSRPPAVTRGARRRRCLKCRGEFASAGIHEQICGTCKNSVEWRSGAYGMAGGRGGRHVGKGSP